MGRAFCTFYFDIKYEFWIDGPSRLCYFEKKLFFLLPFHLLTYEKEFPEYETDEVKREELLQHYTDLMERLDESVRAGELSTYEKTTIIAMMKKIKNHLLKKYSKLEEGLGVIMGGKILDYEAKDILKQGIEQGIEQGKLALIRRKLEKGHSIEQIAEALEESTETIQKLMKEHITE